jgi:hypothetical protein
MTLSRIYIKAVVIPGIIMVLGVLVYAIIENRNYKSEWLTSEAVIQMIFVFALLYWICICILALPLFLNKNQKVNSNNIISLLSWFLLPGILMGIVIQKAISEYLTVERDSGTIVYAILMTLPFVIGLIWGFWKFRTLQGNNLN